MTWIWLRLIDFARPMYEWQGVDVDQLRAIVGIKLEMDNRRAPAFRMQQQKKEHSSSFGTTLFLYGLFGGFLSLMIIYIPSIVLPFSIYYAYLMVMIVMTLISDFSAILLDTSDNTIILPRPVSAKTFYAARATHILLYIGQIAIGLSFIPIIVTFFVYGPWIGIVVILTTVLSVIFSVSLTNGLYLLMMRFTSEERLKSLINYFQIAMAIIMMGGYQILPRLLGLSEMAMATSEMKWWAILIPPMWMTGFVKMVNELTIEPIYVATTFLALVVPLASWKAVNTFLAPYFTKKLTDLGTSSSPVQETTARTSTRQSFGARLGNLVTKAGLERATFSLVSYAFSRDRKLKLRIYPAIGSFVVIMAVMLFRKAKGDVSIMEYLQSLGQTETHLFVIYACIFILFSVAFEIHFSDEHKAAWIFQAAPITSPGKILTGTLKAILVRFFVPVYTVATIVILLIWRERAIPDLFFGALASVLLMFSIFLLSHKNLPLSLEPSARNQGSSFVRTIFSLLVIGLLGIGHYFLSKIDLIIWLACPVLLAGTYGVLRAYGDVKWDDIES